MPVEEDEAGMETPTARHAPKLNVSQQSMNVWVDVVVFVEHRVEVRVVDGCQQREVRP